MPSAAAVPPNGGPAFRAALRTPAFAMLYGAELQSIIGSQLARVALSVLVFEKTGSATATALTYATTFLPAILGGFAVGTLGARLAHRRTLIVCDALRAALFAAMAVPQTPLPATIVLLVLAVFLEPAFSAAEVGFLAAALPPAVFRAATGLRMLGNQGAQVAGFAVGGIAVAALGARPALALNALTFAISAALIWFGLHAGRAGSPTRGEIAACAPAGSSPSAASAWKWLRHERPMRGLLALSGLAALFVVPEGLAVPFTAAAHGSTTQAGLLLATIPLGSVVGVLGVLRWIPSRRRGRHAGLLAIGCGVPLVVSALAPRWPVALGCWFVCGVLAAYQVDAMSLIVQFTPDRLRSAVVGIGSASLVGAQGMGLIVFGAIAQWLSPAHAIGVAGALGSLGAAFLVLGPLRGVGSAEAPEQRVPEYLEDHCQNKDETGVGGRPHPTSASEAGPLPQ